jgi:pyruvate carboxylase
MASRLRPIRKLLVANRGEIAIRVFRAATELGIPSVGIYANEDRFALHRLKVDESYPIGAGRSPVEAYLDIPGIIEVAKRSGANAIHPGYGFLSENPAFAEACAAAGILFVGPTPAVMRQLGNKVEARALAVAAGVPVMPATGPLPGDVAQAAKMAEEIGYPLMLKASWGGGGRGMRVIENAGDLAALLPAARREAKVAFGNDEVYLEKLVRQARHVEVQILGDTHGNAIHLFERDCSVQRRNQKVVERAPAPYLNDAERQAFCDAALKLARQVRYSNAGTVEFLVDAETGAFYFIEVNPRVQVEHTVTETVTGIDIVKAQIRIAQGAMIGQPDSGVPVQSDIRLNGHAIQCRITTEDPNNNFVPDYGRIDAYRSPGGFGIRLDGGTAFSGAQISRHFDSLLVKVTAWAPTVDDAIDRMRRALGEFRVRGVTTNLTFLQAVVSHPRFRSARYTTRFVDTTPELFRGTPARDRATKLLAFIADVLINGNSEMKGRAVPAQPKLARLPTIGDDRPVKAGTKQRLDELGAEGFARWMRERKEVLITDTTFRDAHQSLLATRVRSIDMTAIAPIYARLVPQLLSVECWGGATFDVAMRFLKEDPWERLAALRQGMPNILLQMLLRSANGVGYTNYPDNVVRFFIRQAAAGGIDLFRVFDSLNWVDNMRVSIDAVRETGALCEAAICYTGDILDPARGKYDLAYYVGLAKQLEAAGAHILGIKDMAGLCKPAAARMLFSALKEEVGLPVHFHTHDTSGISAASVLAAVDAGVDAVDAAMDAFSGLTSQPSLGSIVAALRHGPRDPGLDGEALATLSRYWEEVRRNYVGFESEFRAGTSDVYVHEMPGGQYTNLREQARALGIENHRWGDVARAYAEVNRMFGDIIKVTPTSKVVGDMALMMVTGGLSAEQVEDPNFEVTFPESVVSLFKGELGQPVGGFPQPLREKVLNGAAPLTVRPGEVLPPADIEAERSAVEKKIGRRVSDLELASWLMYPKVFTDFAAHRRTFGDVSVLPTTTFFYGMPLGDEVVFQLEPGRTMIIRFLAVGHPNDLGQRTLFFEVDGHPRTVKVADRAVAPTRALAPKADDANPKHVGAPMPGVITNLSVKPGQKVVRGAPLLAIEAMKMEIMVNAERDGTIERVTVAVGQRVDTKDLLLTLGEA